MYGSHAPRSARGLQRNYEDQALVYRRQIEFLIEERQHYQELFQELQPTFRDGEQRLSRLDTTIRKIIPELQEYTIDFNKTVAKWQQLVADYEIADTVTPMTGRGPYTHQASRSSRSPISIRQLSMLSSCSSSTTTVIFWTQ
ncbi:hypothetical protein AAVH_22754 [Aphelenchoides avenae]|nr:hypothetical protein AAVH_22754 [Aphelenchus avenae]